MMMMKRKSQQKTSGDSSDGSSPLSGLPQRLTDPLGTGQEVASRQGNVSLMIAAGVKGQAEVSVTTRPRWGCDNESTLRGEGM